MDPQLLVLTPREQVLLQLVSKQFLALARANTLWRLHCYEESWANIEASRSAGTAPASLVGNATTSLSSLGQTSLRSLIQPQSANEAEVDGRNGPRISSLAERSRAATAWDPSYEKEEVDWYSEYIARHGPTSFNWLQQPFTMGVQDKRKLARDVKGMGLFRDWSSARQDKVVAPLDDGSVCIWDLHHSHAVGPQSTKGRVLGISEPGILTADLSQKRKNSTSDPALEFMNLGEFVSVDSVNRRVYMAVANALNEVDLETLRVVSQQRYAWPIFALSQETDYSAPLTLATTKSLHIHDPRLFSSQEEEISNIRCETAAAHTFASLSEPSPLSVLHPPTPHENTILVAGRFPSILHYDRRFFPRLQNAVHSGGGLCGLVSAPSPQFNVCSDSTGPGSHKVVTCGEYKGRGSLELYNLTSPSHDQSRDLSDMPSGLSSAVYQNRQSAARSKLLSVASHGARLVYSDADGNVKWVERDGRTEVRRWNINTYLSDMKALGQDRRSQAGLEPNEDDDDTGGLWANPANSYSNSQVVQKALPTNGNLTDDELLIWTGERIGRIKFSGAEEPDCDAEDEEDIVVDEKLDSTAREEVLHQKREQLRREREYARTMRKALERQADEVRRTGGFGME